jgi:hypothetical protein
MRFTLYDGGERVSRHESAGEAQAAALDRVRGTADERIRWVKGEAGSVLGFVAECARFTIRNQEARDARTDFSAVPPIAYQSEFYYAGSRGTSRSRDAGTRRR